MATTALMGLWAETSIHAGAGRSIAGIDLPIQREGHNGWPCVFGSAVKGALRAKAESEWGRDNASVAYVFGPDSDQAKASEHAGALMVGDARLLLLPVRSLTGHFKWVTCPALLKRLQRDAARLDVGLDGFVVPAQVTDLEAGLQAVGSGYLFLEEYRINTTKSSDLLAIAKVLAKLSGIAVKDLESQLVLVSDVLFGYLCQYATPVAAHIAIDNTNKTVKAGMLWYEETLPPETVLYLALAANSVRDAKVKDSYGNDHEEKFIDQAVTSSKAQAILKSITHTLFTHPYLQLGGNETVGMGWCKVTVSLGNGV